MSTIRNIKYLKDSVQFKISEDENIKYKSFLEMGKNGGKSIFKKIPVTQKDLAGKNKAKFQHPWLSKAAVVPQEIISSEAFRILLGGQFSPKYRVCMDGSRPTVVVTRLLNHFTPWVTVCKNMVNLSSDEVSSLNYQGDYDSEYGQKAVKYLKATAELNNFSKIFAVCILFGKDDLHCGNWGMVEIEGKKYAATVDHEKALKYGFNLYHLLYHYGHRKERLLTPEFVSACREVLADYESKKDLIRQVMAECIDSIMSSIDEVPSIESVMDNIESNKIQLIHLLFQIEAEMAIKQGDAIALRNALINLPEYYVSKRDDHGFYSIIISMQNYSDGFVDPRRGVNFRGFIKLRNSDDGDLLKGGLRYDNSGDLILPRSLPAKSPEDIKIQNELLAVYDEVANDKRSEQARKFQFRS